MCQGETGSVPQGIKNPGDCGVRGGGGEAGVAWPLREQGIQSPERGQAKVQGPGTILKEKGPEEEAGSGTL